MNVITLRLLSTAAVFSSVGGRGAIHQEWWMNKLVRFRRWRVPESRRSHVGALSWELQPNLWSQVKVSPHVRWNPSDGSSWIHRNSCGCRFTGRSLSTGSLSSLLLLHRKRFTLEPVEILVSSSLSKTLWRWQDLGWNSVMKLQYRQ